MHARGMIARHLLRACAALALLWGPHGPFDARAAEPPDLTVSPEQDARQAAIYRYEAQMAQALYQRLRYPRAALDKRLEGNAYLVIHLKEDGALGEVELRESSGHAVLDEEAVLAARKSRPFVKIPDPLRGTAFTARARVMFRHSP